MRVRHFNDNKLAWIYGLLLVLIATAFWTQSRVPALNEKAATGDRINISSIAFDTVRVVDDSQPLVERIFWSSVNWGYTNLKGMTFGFLLGATLLSLIQSVPRSLQSRSDYLNAVYGMAIGAPLGVCVNCATPIAQGMVEANTRLTTALSALFSSPTLNPIVLTMAFALLPVHLALTKVVATLVFILLIVPLLLRLLDQGETRTQSGGLALSSTGGSAQLDLQGGEMCSILVVPSRWRDAVRIAVSSVGRNLWLILKITFPLMVVAGILGAALVESLPDQSLSNLSMAPITVLAVSGIGAFLPVPIAFDVLAVNALISAGIPVGIGASLLFSLGIFSIYPAMVIARTVSARLSASLFVAVVGVAVLVGYVASSIDESVTSSALVALERELGGDDDSSVLQAAAETCGALDDSLSAPCLEQFFKADIFRQSLTSICDSGKGRAAAADVSLVQQVCKNVSEYRRVEAGATRRNDASICGEIGRLHLAEECIISVTLQNGLASSAIEQCSLIETEWTRRSCRQAVINRRLVMKSAEACDVALSREEQALCVDELNAYIASEFDDLDTCLLLTSKRAAAECQRRVVRERVVDIQDYGVCDEVENIDLVRECEGLVISQQSARMGNLAGCDALPATYEQVGCRVNVAIEKIRSQRLSSGVADVLSTTSTSMEKSQSSTADGGCSGPECDSRKVTWSNIVDGGGIRLEVSGLEEIHESRETVFDQLPGSQLGLAESWEFQFSDFMEPFVVGKGIASGDFNNDSWPDLALAWEHGVLLYRNKGDGSFAKFADLRPNGASKNAFVVALVDIDNDGWQDVFMSAYGGSNHIFLSQQGSFDSSVVESLPPTDSVVALAAGFADWDRDGDIDIFLGNWSYGTEGAFIPEKSHNVWYRNGPTGFEPELADETPGETLSVLISDIDDDSLVDVVVGNDRKEPDVYYLGSAAGEFGRVTSETGRVPVTSFNTMSYEMADFNNDLLPDLFSTDMSFAPAPRRNYCDAVEGTAQERCRLLLEGRAAVSSTDVDWCNSLDAANRGDCYAAIMISLAHKRKDRSLCRMVPVSLPGKREFCEVIADRTSEVTTRIEPDDLLQFESNKLLLGAQGGAFVDATELFGVANSYWSWSGKAADLDNDGWQDIYVGNGFGFGGQQSIHSNVFYHNENGQQFVQAEEEFGLVNHLNTPSFTYLDYDRDGDIDIIATTVMSGPVVFRNNSNRGNSISISLIDERANRFCVGCKVIVTYKDGVRTSMREIKLSGGFMAYDDPTVHIGLGDADVVDSIQALWSDGERWDFERRIEANRHYRITRKVSGK